MDKFMDDMFGGLLGNDVDRPVIFWLWHDKWARKLGGKNVRALLPKLYRF